MSGPTHHPAGGVPADDTAAFQLIAEGVSRLLGFGVVVVARRAGDALQPVAVADNGLLGADGGRGAERLLETSWPLEEVAATLAEGGEWGRFRFSRRGPGGSSDGWVGESPPLDLSGWHPQSALRAPIQGTDGELIGLLSVDVPRGGIFPGPAQLAVLERYADHTRRELHSALERERLDERARLLRTAREAVRRAAGHATLLGAVDEACSALLEGFGGVGLRLRVFDGEEPGFVRSLEARSISASPEMAGVSRAASEQLWRRGEVAVLTHDDLGPLTDPGMRAMVLDDLRRNGLDSLLHIPLGSGATCWGSLILLRDASAPRWTDAECSVALDIGRDLGQVLHRVRLQERQRALIRDLSALDDYQSSLISAVAAQLRGPLHRIENHLHRIADPAEGIDMAAVDGIEEGAAAMTQVVQDLLLLSRLAHPDDRPHLEVVDLRSIVRRTATAAGAEAAERQLTLSTRLPAVPTPVHGDGEELARLLAELIENGLRYTPAGGSVAVGLEIDRESALVTVADSGIGIAEGERPHILTDFYRGAAARRAEPSGTGLGMSIVHRIARRHDATLEVESAVGSGTRVRVAFPRAAAQP